MSRSAIVAGALALASATVCAQSVTLYGVVDTGIEYVDRIGASHDSVVRMPNLSGTVPSRWGMRGTEDLGGGLKSLFVLESGFAPDSAVSNQGGRLFGRQALVGLSGRWGQLSFGRQYTMLFWSTLDSDILGPNTFSSGSLDSYLPNARADNAIAYKGTFGGFTLGGTYSFGRDAVNAGPSPSGTNCAGENPADRRACRQWSAMLRYEAPRWSANITYDAQRGGPGAFGGLTSSALRDDRLTINGYAFVGDAKLGAGWIRRDNRASATPRSDLWYAGVSYPVTAAFTVDAQAFHLRFHDSANKAWLFAARGTYAFTRRTSVYATAGYLDNRGTLNYSVSSAAVGANPVAGGNQFGAMIGVKTIF